MTAFSSIPLTGAMLLSFVGFTQISNQPHYRWVSMTSNDPLPPNRIGLSRDSEHNYDQSICRVAIHGGLHPGKILPDIRTCNVSWGGSGADYHQFEILVGDAQGVWGFHGGPGGMDFTNALVAGHEDNGAAIYACAGQHINPGGGEMQIGKFVAGNCDVEYGGKELALSNKRLYYMPPNYVIENP